MEKSSQIIIDEKETSIIKHRWILSNRFLFVFVFVFTLEKKNTLAFVFLLSFPVFI